MLFSAWQCSQLNTQRHNLGSLISLPFIHAQKKWHSCPIQSADPSLVSSYTEEEEEEGGIRSRLWADEWLHQSPADPQGTEQNYLAQTQAKKEPWGATHVKEYTGFIRNFHHKQEATMFAKIILYIKCYQLSCLHSPYIFEMCLREPLWPRLSRTYLSCPICSTTLSWNCSQTSCLWNALKIVLFHSFTLQISITKV